MLRIRPGIEPMTFRTCGQHAYHKTIEGVDKGNHILHFMEALQIKQINNFPLNPTVSLNKPQGIQVRR